jgi:hypothetical protein
LRATYEKLVGAIATFVPRRPLPSSRISTNNVFALSDADINAGLVVRKGDGKSSRLYLALGLVFIT